MSFPSQFVEKYFSRRFSWEGEIDYFDNVFLFFRVTLKQPVGTYPIGTRFNSIHLSFDNEGDLKVRGDLRRDPTTWEEQDNLMEERLEVNQDVEPEYEQHPHEVSVDLSPFFAV